MSRPRPEKGNKGCRQWPAYAAAAWSGMFAARGAYWAVGGTVGLSTLSEGIREAHAAADPVLFAALWATVALELFGVGLALSLVRPWGRTVPDRSPFGGCRTVPVWLPVLLASGASALLIGHGAVFCGFGVRAALSDSVDATTEMLWYSLGWGPWFVLGGLLFAAAVHGYVARASVPGSRRRTIAAAASAVGAVGGLTAAAAPFAVTALAALA